MPGMDIDAKLGLAQFHRPPPSNEPSGVALDRYPPVSPAIRLRATPLRLAALRRSSSALSSASRDDVVGGGAMGSGVLGIGSVLDLLLKSLRLLLLQDRPIAAEASPACGNRTAGSSAGAEGTRRGEAAAAAGPAAAAAAV